jgi:hypothetical protein
MNTAIFINNPVIEKYFELVDQILYTFATILGVIVGVTVWVANRVSDWYNNGGQVTLLRYTQRVLLFVTTSTEKLYYWVCDVTDSEVAQ